MRTLIFATSLCAAMLGNCFAQNSSAAMVRLQTKIPPQLLGQALRQFSESRHIQVLFLTKDVKGLRTAGASGNLTAEEALTRLLSGTGLNYRYVDSNAVSIVPAQPKEEASQKASVREPAQHQLRTDQNGKLPNRSPNGADPPDTQPTPRDTLKTHNPQDLREVVITGTHIAGVQAIASPSLTYSSNYIYSTGVGSIAEFLQQVPSNFSETTETNESSVPNGPGAVLGSRVGAVGFDIHGLGVQSTLVLVNGHRMSAGSNDGNFTDVSALPLSAIDHITIVKDSASAIYGSDAVGGVVNIVTRSSFSGSETRVRYGKVTMGGRAETTASETLGSSWGGGTALLSYEYGDETPLGAGSRSFSSQVPTPFSLLPEQVKHSLYGSVAQSLPGNLTLSGFALYGHRDIQDSYMYAGNYSVLDSSTVNSYTTEADLGKEFDSGDVASASIEYSTNDSHHAAVLRTPSSTQYGPDANTDGRSQLAALDLDYSGKFTVPGNRRIRYALGAQARKENLSYSDYLAHTAYQPDRTVLSEYIEIHAPVVRSVLLTAAYRHEHYSVFGSTSNPKVGLQWTPSTSMSVSATYSTAFRAPTLFDMNPTPTEAVYVTLPDPQIGGTFGGCAFSPPPQVGCTPSLLLFGGNPGLKPETAKSWTSTLTIHPNSIKGLSVSLSFYDIKDYDRVNNVGTELPSPFDALLEENELGSTVVERGLPNQEIQQLAQSAGPNLYNFFFPGVLPASVTTLVDSRNLNLSELSTRGLDLDATYSHELGLATASSELEATKVLQYVTQFSPATPSVDVLNTAYNPPSLRLRLHESISLGRVAGSLFADYIGSYTNPFVTPIAPVASWLTFNASISYRLQLNSRHGGGADFTIGCLNIANRNPPFVGNPAYRINFDGANASPLGRFVYAEARVHL